MKVERYTVRESFTLNILALRCTYNWSCGSTQSNRKKLSSFSSQYSALYKYSPPMNISTFCNITNWNWNQIHWGLWSMVVGAWYWEVSLASWLLFCLILSLSSYWLLVNGLFQQSRQCAIFIPVLILDLMTCWGLFKVCNVFYNQTLVNTFPELSVWCGFDFEPTDNPNPEYHRQDEL